MAQRPDCQAVVVPAVALANTLYKNCFPRTAMIDEVLMLLKNQLNSYFRTQFQLQEDKTVFLTGEKSDPLTFPLNQVVPLLVNIEEEKVLRPANRYEEYYDKPAGRRMGMHPPIRISLSVLFVCKFSAYEQSLKFLSHIMRFFQQHQVLDQDNCPELKDHSEIYQLRLELITMTLAQQNELWNALKTQYLPSALYRVGLLTFRDGKEEEVKQINATEIRTKQLAVGSLAPAEARPPQTS